MSTRTLLVNLTLAAGLGAAVFLAGCEDESAEQALEQKREIQQIGRDYALTVGGEGEAESIATRSAGAATGTDGSSQAAALLEASARRDLASAWLKDAGELEAENRARRSVVRGLASGSTTVGAAAHSLQQFDPGATRQQIQQELARARTRLEEARTRVRELEGPVQTLVSENESDRQQVADLRAQSRELREQAFEQGDVEGFDEIKQAVALDQQADEIEALIARREIELMGLRSRLDYHRTRVAQFEDLIERANEALAALESSGATYAERAGELTGDLGGMRQRVNAELAEIESTMAQLDDLYNQINTALETAASKAQMAARGPGAESAKLLQTRVLQLAGASHRMRAAAHDDHAALLALLAGIEALEGAGDFSSQAQQARQMQASEMQAAQEAFTSAAQVLSGMQGDAAMLRTQLEAAAQGEAVDLSAFRSANAGGSSPAAPSGAGASSPEALLRALRQAEQQGDASGLVGLIHASNSAGQAMKQALGPMIAAIQELDQAIQQQFGKSMNELGPGSGQMNISGFSDLDDARIDTSGGGAAIVVSTPMGEDRTPLIEVNGSWYIDGDALAEQQGGAQAAAMMQQMSQAISRAFRDLARKIRDGEITTEEQLGEAMMNAFMGGMGGGGQGFPGGGN